MTILTPEELRGMAANAHDWPECIGEIVESHEELRAEFRKVCRRLDEYQEEIYQLQQDYERAIRLS